MTNPANFLRPLLDLVLPERCPSCGIITPMGGDFCAACWAQLYFPTEPWCATCAAPLPFLEAEGQQCLTCIARAPVHDGIRTVTAYDNISRQVALKLKYGGKIGLAKLIARHMIRHLPANRKGLIITPVPLHWTRLWARSFNQSALIGSALAGQSGLRHIPDMLVRRRRTPLLKEMSAANRRKIVGNAFALNPRYSSQIKGARLLLIDDVYTSGATSDACIRALKKAGADWVQLFCWARVLPNHERDAAQISAGPA